MLYGENKNMRSKRSIGVTIFGFIITLTIPILGAIILFLPNFSLSLYSKMSIIAGICVHILLGIGILKLNNLARKIVVGIGWYLVIATPILITIMYTIIYKRTGIIFDPSIYWIFLLFLPGWIYWVLLIYFFSRPNVKDQFK